MKEFQTVVGNFMADIKIFWPLNKIFYSVIVHHWLIIIFRVYYSTWLACDINKQSTYSMWSMWIISTFYIYEYTSCVVSIRGFFKYYNTMSRGICKTTWRYEKNLKGFNKQGNWWWTVKINAENTLECKNKMHLLAFVFVKTDGIRFFILNTLSFDRPLV